MSDVGLPGSGPSAECVIIVKSNLGVDAGGMARMASPIRHRPARDVPSRIRRRSRTLAASHRRPYLRRMSLSRRDFARLLAVSGTASLFPTRVQALAQRGAALDEFGFSSDPLPRTPAEPDEKFWRDVRSRFIYTEQIRSRFQVCGMNRDVLRRQSLLNYALHLVLCYRGERRVIAVEK